MLLKCQSCGTENRNIGVWHYPPQHRGHGLTPIHRLSPSTAARGGEWLGACVVGIVAGGATFTGADLIVIGVIGNPQRTLGGTADHHDFGISHDTVGIYHHDLTSLESGG